MVKGPYTKAFTSHDRVERLPLVVLNSILFSRSINRSGVCVVIPVTSHCCQYDTI
jgi:hypothetical protein